MKYKCIVSYDGTNFHGFQTQDIKEIKDLEENPRTVQEEIEKVLTQIEKKKVNITYASRTDAGVHALGQVFHFESSLNITELSMKRAINPPLRGKTAFGLLEKGVLKRYIIGTACRRHVKD